MAGMTIDELAETMRDIDFGMLSTRTEGGALASRPMSNNRQVDFDGDSYFFSYDHARTIADIGRDPQVGLTFSGKPGLLGRPPVFVAIEGRADLIRDCAQFEAHWTGDLDRWFPQGTETPGMVLIKVHANRIHYWDGEEQGEVPV